MADRVGVGVDQRGAGLTPTPHSREEDMKLRALRLRRETAKSPVLASIQQPQHDGRKLTAEEASHFDGGSY